MYTCSPWIHMYRPQQLTDIDRRSIRPNWDHHWNIARVWFVLWHLDMLILLDIYPKEYYAYCWDTAWSSKSLHHLMLWYHQAQAKSQPPLPPRWCSNSILFPACVCSYYRAQIEHDVARAIKMMLTQWLELWASVNGITGAMHTEYALVYNLVIKYLKRGRKKQ